MQKYDALCFNTDLVIQRKIAELLNKGRRVKLLKLNKISKTKSLFFGELIRTVLFSSKQNFYMNVIQCLLITNIFPLTNIIRVVKEGQCTLSRVVMARVAILLLESVIRFSSSMLQAVTAAGCFMATYQIQSLLIIYFKINFFVFAFDIDGHGNNFSCKFLIFVLPVKCLQSFTLQLF